MVVGRWSYGDGCTAMVAVVTAEEAKEAELIHGVGVQCSGWCPMLH